MIIGVPEERYEETRVALIPPVAEGLVEDGFDVLVAAGAGDDAGWSDDEYQAVGCEIVDDDDVFERSDVLFQVRALGAAAESETDRYQEGQIVIGLLGPYDVDDELETLAGQDVTSFALELMPRISRAQSMDALSAMDSISGYKATMMAAETLPKILPMEMTAAGTIQPADVFVVGAGVAGLKAIATAERLGASTKAYDIRPEVKEEVESLGGEFVELDLETDDDASDDQGQATEQDEEFIRKQREMMTRVVGEADVVITTANIPGRPAPELVTTEMIEEMAPGSVVVDLAAKRGGNCEPTQPDERITHEGVEIIGPTNVPATVASTSSRLYANNVVNFFENLLDDGEVVVDTDDEIIDDTMLTRDGVVRDPHLDDEAEEEEEEEGVEQERTEVDE
ncbi:Re/Si-specific NAD(P)(+) transhydrogenase subunit alpha [Natronoarchaeum sp. GCM10025703]|uniref:Re/Si-specific NAD(P)(+) transhydrogenase subunit alpha n=1 Tax=unclassified Natronoarchaeum TaxID=2620183 RepID=UPI00360BF6EA